MESKNKSILIPITILLIISLSSIPFNGCKSKKDFSVTWELISNTHRDDPSTRAVFTISNSSCFLLNGHNWELHFNQSPRQILLNRFENEQNALVEHISGDWFRIKPTENFILKPGEQIKIFYETSHWFIKESDAPQGLYFVLKESNGKEKIVEVDDYKIELFTRKEQLSRHRNDFEPQPTPQNDFEKNRNLSVIPDNKLLTIIPSPKSQSIEKETIYLSNNLQINYNCSDLLFEANYLKDQLKELLGWDVLVADGTVPTENVIVLTIDKSLNLPNEGYNLKVGKDKAIRIEASEKIGIFYGIQSLISLIPISDLLKKAGSTELPVISINDSPRFGYRGVHVDVVRHFFPKETIFKLIDILAFYKINILHLHLTDDEGWRIEIKKLPELTEVGGKRGHTSKESAALHPAYGSGPTAFAQGKNGSGFFSQTDFIEILSYATQRHIRVIPEINMPGHSRAAIKAMESRYKQFISKGDSASANEFRLIDPDDKSVYLSAQFYNDNIVNVARESVYRFFETVVDEIVELYRQANAPLEILHVGGDEIPRGAWTKSPMVDGLMNKRTDIKHYENLHSYFTERALEILDNKKLKMAGWEEVAMHTDNGHVPNPKFANGKVIPYVWNSLWGSQDLAYRLANRGYPVVMCHVTNFYFDLAYSNHPKEPGLYWGGFVNTRSAWYYSPFDIFSTTQKDNLGRPIDTELEYKDMERLKPEARKNIVGLQAQLWSETIKNQEMLEYSLLPKLIGFAQTAWAQERKWESIKSNEFRNKLVEEDWNVFTNTLAKKELPRLSILFGGYNYRIPPPGATIIEGYLYVNAEFPGLDVRYTTDGTEPDINSLLFSEPVEVSNQTIKLKTFDVAGRESRTVEIEKMEHR